MRVLLAAKHAPEGRRRIGGVQTWCRTVAKELQARGHEAVTWGPEQTAPLGGFDLGIIANAVDAARAFAWCRQTINVSHGIIPAEKPGTGDLTAFTSEEVRDHWGGSGPVIRQPIDLDFWKPGDAPRVYLTRFSYRGGLSFVPALANRMGLRALHLKNLDEQRVRDGIWKSVCVLASGRAALEAMACNIPVVICDHRAAYQTELMDTSPRNAMVRNYSGRGGVVPTPESLRHAIERAVAEGGLRAHVEKHHDVRNIVDQLLGLL